MVEHDRASRGATAEELFRLLVENVEDCAILVIDPAGRVEHWNAGAERLLGYAEAEIVGHSADRFFTPEDIREGVLRREMREAQEHGRAETDRWLVRKDGSRFWCSGTLTPLWNEWNGVRGFATIIRDRTALTQAREESARRAEESEQRRRLYEAALLNTPDLVYVFDLDHRFIYANAVLLAMWGRTWEEAIGKNCIELGYAPWHAALHDQEIEQVVATKQSIKGEVPFAGAFGNRVYEYIFVPVLSVHGEVEAVAGTTRDVTERKQAEESLREANAILRSFYETAPLQMGVVDVLEHDILHLTDNTATASFLGVKPDALRNRLASEIGVPAAHIERWIGHYRESERSKSPIRFEYLHETPQASRWLSAIVSCIEKISEHQLRCSYVVEDITDRKRAEAELRRAEQSSRQILESISDAFFALDRNWRYTYVNPQAERVLDRKPGELLGRVVWEEYPGLAGSEFESAFRRVETERVTLSLTSYYPDHDRWYETHIYPATDGMSVYFRDVTERKRAEEELARLTAASEQQRRMYETALSNSADFNYVFDLEGRFRYVNQALLGLWGKTLPEAVGKNFFELDYPPELAARLQRQIEDVIATKQFVRGETPYSTAQGERQYEYIFVPVVGAGGTVEAVAGSTRDITDRKSAEEQLREAERRWRSLAEALPNLVWTDLPDGQCDYLSSQWGSYTGIPENELLGLNWLERVIHPDDRDRTRACWLEAVADMGIYDLEYRIRRHDGEYHWFKTRGVPIRNDQGRIVKWIGACTDIQDQKQAQQALAESEERFRQLADSMPQMVWTAGPDGMIDYQNRRWEEFTGFAGGSGNAEWAQILHPDDAPTARQRWAASVQSGAPFEMEIRLYQRRSRCYRWHLVRTVAVHDAEGKVARWFGTATDIQEQKRAAESSRYLAEASAALSEVVDYESTLLKIANLAVPYFADWSAVDLVKEDGSLRRLAVAHQNPDQARLAHELMRKYPADPQSPTGVGAVLRTGQPQIVEQITDEMLVQSAKDEQHLQMIRALGLHSYICVPLIAAGNPLGALVFATAESGRRYNEADLALANDLARRAAVALENTQLYRALREADRRKNEFLAVLAHELRNPLAPIKGALDLLQFTGGKEEELAPLREMMDRQVQQMVHLIDDLLDVSRITSGKIVLRKKRLDLSDVVKGAIETSRPLIDRARHILTVSMPPHPLYVEGDQTRLAQVLSNLLANSAKYTPEGGRLWLSVSRDGREAVIRVRDTGMGIPVEMLRLIFEMFTQVDRNIGRSQGGLGIGLSLVRSLVKMHDGTVEAHSDGPGKGSEFLVRLPLAADDQAQPRDNGQQDPGRPLANSPTKRRVLVVDDNKDSARALGMLLEVLSNEVCIAHDGASALELAASFLPHVVLLDIGLPGMSGHDVARRMRQMPGVKDALLVAQTGWGQEDDKRQSENAGFDAHLVKPVDIAALRQLMGGLPTHSG